MVSSVAALCFAGLPTWRSGWYLRVGRRNECFAVFEGGAVGRLELRVQLALSDRGGAGRRGEAAAAARALARRRGRLCEVVDAGGPACFCAAAAARSSSAPPAHAPPLSADSRLLRSSASRHRRSLAPLELGLQLVVGELDRSWCLAGAPALSSRAFRFELGQIRSAVSARCSSAPFLVSAAASLRCFGRGPPLRSRTSSRGESASSAAMMIFFCSRFSSSSMYCCSTVTSRSAISGLQVTTMPSSLNECCRRGAACAGSRSRPWSSTYVALALAVGAGLVQHAADATRACACGSSRPGRARRSW